MMNMNNEEFDRKRHLSWSNKPSLLLIFNNSRNPNPERIKWWPRQRSSLAKRVRS